MGRRRRGWLRGAALALLVVTALAACGGPDEEPAEEADVEEVATETGAFFEDASPAAFASPSGVGRPLEVETVQVTISDGRLDPERVEGQLGQSFVLTVVGDGSEHTIEIEGLVTEESIAAEGETNVDFTIEGEPGEKEIRLDGEPAGVFEAMEVGGITDG